mgnify:CR=1 FL=1
MPAPVDDNRWYNVLLPYYLKFGAAEPTAAALRIPFDETYCALIEELKPEVVSFHFGLPDERLLERVQAAGAVVIGCATTVAEAIFLDAKFEAELVELGGEGLAQLRHPRS